MKSSRKYCTTELICFLIPHCIHVDDDDDDDDDDNDNDDDQEEHTEFYSKLFVHTPPLKME